jgi:hypothetical protein
MFGSEQKEICDTDGEQSQEHALSVLSSHLGSPVCRSFCKDSHIKSEVSAFCLWRLMSDVKSSIKEKYFTFSVFRITELMTSSNKFLNQINL